LLFVLCILLGLIEPIQIIFQFLGIIGGVVQVVEVFSSHNCNKLLQIIGVPLITVEVLAQHTYSPSEEMVQQALTLDGTVLKSRKLRHGQQ
jgi:hypothetical protein